MIFKCVRGLIVVCSCTIFFVFPRFYARASATSVAVPENTANHFAAVDPYLQVMQMRRGVNIVGYDPIWEDFDKRRFKQNYFKLLHDGGFNTVRVNLQAFAHMDSQYRLNPEWFKTLDWVVDNALANGLSVILDEHDYVPCGEDAVTCHAKLTAFWEQVAPRYKNMPNEVMFEILNEPNKAISAPLWNSILKQELAIIRVTNPERNVVIGPAWWNSINALNTLDLPKDDPHIIVTVHYYLPMRFTHQGAPWAGELVNLSGITWGTDVDRQAVVSDFAKVQEWAKANDRPILLGEFGAYDKGDIDSRVKYTSAVARTAESLGWAWTYWQFDSNYIVYNVEKDAWIEPIRKALVP